MPAFLAHYSCGLAAFHSLNETRLKQCIRNHHGIYSIGLAGPDLFFYALGESIRPGKNLGTMIHEARTGEFLRNLYRAALQEKGTAQDAALAYSAGFFGHYCLDTSCHPLVVKLCGTGSPRTTGRHFSFEASMDRLICQKMLHRDISHSRQLSIIKCRSYEQHIASRILAKALALTFPDVKAAAFSLNEQRIRIIFREYVLGSRFLTDPKRYKEWFFRKMENTFRGYPVISPLFINGNTYCVTQREEEQFLRRFYRGTCFCSRVLTAMSEAVDAPDSCEASDKLFRQVGSLSYKTGRDCRTEQVHPEL